MSDKFLDFMSLSAKLSGRSRSSIDRDVKEGRLPKPLKMGQRVYWSNAAVEAHLAKMMENQNPEAVP